MVTAAIFQFLLNLLLIYMTHNNKKGLERFEDMGMISLQGILTCPYCKGEFTTYETYRAHECNNGWAVKNCVSVNCTTGNYDAHGNNLGFPCKACGSVFSTIQTYAAHAPCNGKG